MADSVCTITTYKGPRGSTVDQRTQTVRGTLAFSAGHYPAGTGVAGTTGWALNWSNVEAVKALPTPPTTGPSSTGSPAPFDCDIKSIASPPSGVVYLWDSVSGNVHMYVVANASSNSSGPLEEYGGTVIPQYIINDIVEFRAVFERNG